MPIRSSTLRTMAVTRCVPCGEVRGDGWCVASVVRRNWSRSYRVSRRMNSRQQEARNRPAPTRRAHAGGLYGLCSRSFNCRAPLRYEPICLTHHTRSSAKPRYSNLPGTRVISLIALFALVRPALAGPPYFSDDPEPTDYKHIEIYLFRQWDSNARWDGRRGRHRGVRQCRISAGQ